MSSQDSDAQVTKTDVGKLMKHPELITDARLRDQVTKCIECDDSYSPLVEKIRRSTGLEYEYLLQERLHNMGIAFSGEEELRAQGLPKTPDVKLLVPFAIKLASPASDLAADATTTSGDSEWFVVNWIESKASFGDEGSHMRTVQDQLWGYRHRYGPGIVVFWFGFISDLREKWKSHGVLLLESFPPAGATIELLQSNVAIPNSTKDKD